MLQNIRDKSQGIVVKVIVGFIVVTFALFGVDALVTGFTTSDTVAEVNGTEITRSELLQTAEAQRRQLISMMGAQIDPAMLDENLLQRRALDELIQRAVLKLHAEDLNLGVSDAQVDQYLTQAEQFQTDGVFDQNKYLTFIRTLGYTPLAFKTRVKQDVLIQQAKSAIAATEFALPTQIAQISELQNQQRNYDYVSFDLAAESEATDVTDAEIEQYFNENQARFISTEQLSLNYVVVSSADFLSKVSVTDAELQQAYQDVLSTEPPEERLTSHILIEAGERRSDQDAEAIILELQQKLLAGETFADLAKQYSDDIGSKSAGGDLGYITKGVMVTEFEDTLFSMKVGDVAEARTEFGYHLIQLNEVVQPDVASFDELSASLEADLLDVKARDALLTAHENITDLAYASDRLTAISEEYNVPVLQTDMFGRDGGSDEISSNPAVIAAAFSPLVLEDKQNSELIELNEDEVVVVRLNQYAPAAQQTLEESRDDVVSLFIQEKASANLRIKAQQAMDNMDIQNWVQVESASRGENEITALAFSLPHPQGEPTVRIETLESGDLVLIRLRQVIPGDSNESDEQEGFYKRYINQIGATLNTQSQQTYLTNKSDIQR